MKRAPTIQIIYRSSSGAVTRGWPVERIGEALSDARGTLWVDVQADKETTDLTSVESLFRDVFHFHPLAIDDALAETHLPKVDDWGDYLFSVFYAIEFEPSSQHLNLCELDIFLGTNYLVTYHVREMPTVAAVWRLLERDTVDRLARGPDHLLYLIIDHGVGDYLTIIEKLDEAIDEAQEEVFHRPSPQTLQQIFRVKRSALKLHRVISPQREVINRLARDEYRQIDAPDRVYFRDVYDHLVRLHDITETLRDLISGALDTYLSAISNRTNDIMKTLTIVTVMFLPMSFLVGFFGMNFFGDTLALRASLPRAFLFWGSCLLMASTPFLIAAWAKRRGWF
jgi:magnesium transporter